MDAALVHRSEGREGGRVEGEKGGQEVKEKEEKRHYYSHHLTR